MTRNLKFSTRSVKPAVGTPVTTLIGGSGWDSTNFLGTGNDLGLRGATTGFWAAWLFTHNAVPSTSQYPFTFFDGSGKGWLWYSAASNGVFNFSCGNLSSAFIASPTHSLISGNIGKIQLLVGVFTGAGGFVRQYASNAEIGSGTATSGYTLPGSGSSLYCSLGTRNNNAGGVPATDFTIFGCAGGNAVPSAGEITQLYADVKALGDIAPISGKTNNLYSVKQDFVSGFPNGLLDKSGSANMTFRGGLASGIDIVTTSNPVWMW